MVLKYFFGQGWVGGKIIPRIRLTSVKDQVEVEAELGNIRYNKVLIQEITKQNSNSFGLQNIFLVKKIKCPKILDSKNIQVQRLFLVKNICFKKGLVNKNICQKNIGKKKFEEKKCGPQRNF